MSCSWQGSGWGVNRALLAPWLGLGPPCPSPARRSLGPCEIFATLRGCGLDVSGVPVLHSQHVTLDTVLPALGARTLVQMGMKGQSLGLCVKPVAERGSG